MGRIQRWAIVAGMAVAIASPVVFSGCYAHADYYDASYGDYHPRDRDEVAWYGRWETETHRQHLDYRKRSTEEQREYWRWRHSEHPDHR